MKRFLTVIRLCGYGSGLLGLALMMIGKRQYGDWRAPLLTVGGTLLAVMFLCFIASYILHALAPFRRQQPPQTRE